MKVTRKNWPQHIIFMPSLDVDGAYDYHTGFGWAPCDAKQNAFLASQRVNHVLLAPLARDEDERRLLRVFNVFCIPGLLKR